MNKEISEIVEFMKEDSGALNKYASSIGKDSVSDEEAERILDAIYATDDEETSDPDKKPD